MPRTYYGPYNEQNNTYAAGDNANIGRFHMGSYLILPDQREYRFALNDGTAEVAGNLYQSVVGQSNHTNTSADVFAVPNPWSARPARPLSIEPSPPYMLAAVFRCCWDGWPLCSNTSPGSIRCHGPPDVLSTIVFAPTPIAFSTDVLMTPFLDFWRSA